MSNQDTLAIYKCDLHIVNTARIGLIHLPSVMNAHLSGQVGALAIDVYEGESAMFFS